MGGPDGSKTRVGGAREDVPHAGPGPRANREYEEEPEGAGEAHSDREPAPSR